jgi:chemotaxis protein CheD
MTASAPLAMQSATLVGMGETVLLGQGESARIVVGSCAGLAIYHRRNRCAALCHIVLPEAAGRPGPPGKFADTAISHMIRLLQDQGALHADLVAKVAGGAQMFATAGPLQIGDANVRAVAAILGEVGIPLLAKVVGGTKGRKLFFTCDTGELVVQSAGETPVVV